MDLYEKIVAIEQPSFFPWCGYLGLIAVSDIFIFYDDVQFERRSWQSRNRILPPNQEWMYINIPTVKASRDSKIKEIDIVKDDSWKTDLLKKIRFAYSNTKYYHQYEETICKVINYPYEKLVDMNIAIIKCLCELIGINSPEFVMASDIDDISGAKTDRLINIMKKIDKRTYISATGAKGYIEADKFKNEAIDLLWYEFIPTEYDQGRHEFVPYMSAIDALFHIGSEETKKYIESIAKKSVFEHNYNN